MPSCAHACVFVFVLSCLLETGWCKHGLAHTGGIAGTIQITVCQALEWCAQVDKQHRIATFLVAANWKRWIIHLCAILSCWYLCLPPDLSLLAKQVWFDTLDWIWIHSLACLHRQILQLNMAFGILGLDSQNGTMFRYIEANISSD